MNFSFILLIFSSGLVWLFLVFLLLLSLWGRAISASHLLMRPSHLGVTHPHLWIARHFIHSLRPVSCACRTAHFAGVHFGLVSAHVSPVQLISFVELVPVFYCVTSPLKITFSQFPLFVFTFSRARCSSLALKLR